MNFTPSRPAYEDMRDGILAAMPTQEEDCIVWQAFAQFGIGQGADGRESCRIFTCSVSITESFTVPAVCAGGSTNTPPTVSIGSPANGTSVVSGTSVTFSGTANDTQDGDISSFLAWTSDRDGPLATDTSSFSTAALSAGTHTVTASVTDSGGLNGSAQVVLTVTNPAGAITLTARGYKVKGQQKADLAWSGATSTNVDVYRNGLLIALTPNDGAYTDNINLKGGGTYIYKICNAGTATCSADVTVAF